MRFMFLTQGTVPGSRKVTLDHEPEQVLVLSELASVDAPPGTTGANDGLICKILNIHVCVHLRLSAANFITL